ncbi:nucleotidyltransferase domain-containing protein [Terrimonas ferruginea]|uniref:nucleotidyltransferase domain-containing protein n=1 Tax=Terrimonas ferruginea TaxID=249 RepID=UPI001B7F7FD1|nr:nucleotidyltransferase domain-containing protein [Terrimonas ferruginea]
MALIIHIGSLPGLLLLLWGGRFPMIIGNVGYSHKNNKQGEMQDLITGKLKELAEKHSIKILYACESGSRAWGFPSTDSDYDVRFIYRHRQEEYLSISMPADTIDLPVNELLDIGGWELRKSLQLFMKSNAPLYEWLQSPIVYYQDQDFSTSLLKLQEHYFSPRAAAHHYLSMATNVWNAESGGDTMRLKKYFYVLRSLLAAQWTVDNQNCPPMQLSLLRVQVLDQNWQNEIDRFLTIKKDVTEKDAIQRSMILDNWIVRTLEYCREKTMSTKPKQFNKAYLDNFFRKQLEYDI